MAGVPIALKDNISVAGEPTTCASRVLEGYRPFYDATVVAKARAACLPIVGKTNMDEFAMGSSSEHSARGAVSNPWDGERVPGGSSGGSAAAVAAGIVPLALGSDTGGSIRQPASFCGVVGLKPTYGSVSRYGLVAFASSLDQIGPLARNVADCAALFDVISGHDPRDSTSLPDADRGGPASAPASLEKGVQGLRVGVPAEMMGEGIVPEVKQAIRGALTQLEGAGAIIEEVTLPRIEVAVPTYYIVACAEASSNLARYDGVRYGRRAPGVDDLASLFGKTRAHGFLPEVKRRIMLGTYVLSSGYHDAYYHKALEVRSLLRQDFKRALHGRDVLIGPVAPTTAFRKGELRDDPVAMYVSDICTIAVNLAGLPGLALPCGYDSRGLPVGLQVLGRPLSEPLLCRVGHSLEQLLDLPERVPSIHVSQPAVT